MTDFLHRLPEFAAHHPLLIAAFVGLLLALIVAEAARLFRGYKELTPAALTQLINRENALVIDLSPLADFEKGHIPGARHVLMSQFDPEHKDLVKARDLPIVVTCRSGTTAGNAARRLVKAGFTRVHTLGGGNAAWTQADLPMAKGRS